MAVVRSQPVSVLRASFLLTAMATGACQCGEVLGSLAPQIYLDVCKSPDRKVDGESVGGYEDCAVDLGSRDLTVPLEKVITVTNPSPSDLELKSVTLEGDPAFELLVSPKTIPSNLSGIITIGVRPMTVSTIESKLVIVSDAKNTKLNDDGESIVEVPISVKGADNGVPDIELVPETCDFGRVANEGVGTCTVSIKNVGQRVLLIDDAKFVPPEGSTTLFSVPASSTGDGGDDGACDPAAGDFCAFAFNGRPPSSQDEIPAGEAIAMQVRFTPDVLGDYVGAIRLLTNDPDETEVVVPLTAKSVVPPTCHISLKSVNGVLVSSQNDPIAPLDDVVLTLSDSTPSENGALIDSYEWRLISQPAGSTATLDSPLNVDTGFTFDNVAGVDLVGTYIVAATVYEAETASINDCTLTFDAIPSDNLLVQVSWDTDEDDVDLHVIKKDAGNRFCVRWDEDNFFEPGPTVSDGTTVTLPAEAAATCVNDFDCEWTHCTAEERNDGGDYTEWDGVTGYTPSDPSLDKDDLNGFGPENTNIDLMQEGDYLVGLNGYSVLTSTEVVLRIYVFGLLSAELTTTLDDNSWWNAAIVRWPADINVQQPCIEDLTDGDDNDDCGP